jgi:hypothetical protein
MTGSLDAVSRVRKLSGDIVLSLLLLALGDILGYVTRKWQSA